MDMKFAAVVLALLALVACTQTTTTGQVATDTQQPAAPAAASDVLEVSMTAKDWEFAPNEIRAQQGQKVRITVTGAEGDHGIGIEGYDAQVKFAEGETKTLEFTADKAGEFVFFCNVPCGSGHRTMRGKLIVE